MNKIKLKAIYVNACIMMSSPEDKFQNICRESAVIEEKVKGILLFAGSRVPTGQFWYHWWNPIIPVFPSKS